MNSQILALAVAAMIAVPAYAQETIALAIEGWTQRASSSGVTSYHCASSICAAGSEVSYKPQPHRPNLSLADLEKHHQTIAQESMGTGRIRDLRISRARERTIDGVRVLQVQRDFEWVDGSTSVLIESRLIGRYSSYSLVSASPKLEWTVNNFEGFLPRIIDIVALTRS